MRTLYPAQAFSPQALLAEIFNSTDTTLTVNDGSLLPAAPNLLTLGTYGDATQETILYTVKSGNVISGITRAVEGVATSWDAGTPVARCFTAKDYDDLRANVTEIADTALQPVAAPTSGNFAGLDANGAVTDSGKKASDFANVSHIHSGYAQIKVFSSVAVASAAWSSDATYAAFPYSATITVSGVTSDMVPEVNFGLTEAASGNFAPVALSGSGTIKIYAAVAPSAAITIPSITCVKAVS